MSTQTVDVAEVIDRTPAGCFQLGVFVLCILIIFLDGFDSQAIGYVAPLIIKDFGIAPSAMAPVFSAGLFGIMIGSFALGPLADYVGRRRVILGCLGLCGALTLATVAVHSVEALLVLRFLTGLTIGGSFPNLIALTDEFAPRRNRASAVMLLICGISFGSMVGGFVAAQLSTEFGWRSVFWVGGLFPLLILPLLVWRLPESIRYLAHKGGQDERIASLLRRIDPKTPIPASAVFQAAAASRPRGATVLQLFREGRARATLLVWAMFFMNLMNIFFMASWLPTILTGAGRTLGLAVVITALFNGAGILGTIMVSRTEGRLPIPGVLGAMYLVGGLLIAAIGSVLESPTLLLVVVALAGFCIIGAQNASNAIVARLYPTAIRSTGVGWAYGVGRFGSIVGPLVGGVLLQMAWKPPVLFLAAGVPSVCAACASFLLLYLTRAQWRPAEPAR